MRVRLRVRAFPPMQVFKKIFIPRTLDQVTNLERDLYRADEDAKAAVRYCNLLRQQPPGVCQLTCAPKLFVSCLKRAVPAGIVLC